MKDSMKYIIMAVLVFGLGAVAYFLGGSDGTNDGIEARTVESINWEKTYDSKSKHPYGTYFIRNLFDKGLKGHSVQDIEVSVQEYFDSTEIQILNEEVTYFFVGKSLNLYNEEVNDLLSFVEEGNNMFIAAEYLPNRLLKELFDNYNDYNYFGYTNDSTVELEIEANGFDFNYVLVNEVKGKPVLNRWRNVNYGLTNRHGGSTIGKAGYRPCFMQFQYGDGKILIHTIPQVFTNKSLSTNNGKRYAEIALSYFPNSTILFDNYSQNALDNGEMEIDNDKTDRSSDDGRGLSDHKTLDFILENPPLRWGYFVLLAGILLFVIFIGKRQQKIMPTMVSNDNSSLEFTETIARLYLKQNQHNKLIVHLENIFKNKIRARYFIAYSDDASFVERLSKKSGVSQKEITHLLKLFRGGANITNVSDEYLVNLYKKLNDFYSKAK